MSRPRAEVEKFIVRACPPCREAGREHVLDAQRKLLDSAFQLRSKKNCVTLKGMKKILKVLNIILVFGLIIIAAGVAFIALPQFGNQALIVRSGSMSPTIDAGSIVVVRNNANKTYNVGNVIAFRSEKNSKTIITHRVVSVERNGEIVSYKTKGDANEEADGWIVDQKNVLGKVQFTLPFFGKILAFAKSDLGFPLLIIFPAVFVILLEAISIIREIRKKRRQHKNELPFGFRLHPGGGFPLAPQDKFKLLGFKVLIPLLAFSLFVPSTLAFFSDSETSTGNTFTAAASFPQTSNLFVSDPFTCSTGATNITDIRGTVTISKDSSLDITATLSGALSNTAYQLWVNQDPGACPLSEPTVPLFITTDGSGNGSNTLNNHALVGGATKFWVSLVGGTDVLRSTAVSF